MRVIQHGATYELGQVTCDKCGCIFAYNLNDVSIEHITEYDTYDRDEYDINIVRCPECDNRIRVFM